MQDDVILSLDGQRHRGWTSVRIMQSLDRVAHAFELELTERWSTGRSTERRSIVAGMPCQVFIDSDLLISGYVDEVSPRYSATEHTLQVIGRSRAGDLVDCSTPGKTYNDQTLLQIAQAEAAPFGIAASAAQGVDVGAAIGTARLEPGQPIYEFLEEWARIRAVRFISDAAGNLIITRAGHTRAAERLQLGVNILEASGGVDLRDRYTLYTALAQTDQYDDPSSNVDIAGTANDDWGAYTRHRPRTFLLESAADAVSAQQRAEWQRNTSYGRSQGVVYTVRGWRQSNGELWQHNQLVSVVDDFAGVNGDRLIVEVNRILDGDGRRTELRVMRPEAYDLVPLPESDISDEDFE